MEPFFEDKRTSNTRKGVFAWLPIHDWTTEQVWARIRAAGTRPHPAYSQGMGRLSCRFCVFAPKSQLVLSARLNPALFAEYLALEKKIGHRFTHKVSLADVQAAVDAGETGADAPDDGCWNM
jgi:3'-phosphoadenosine 5'-phosphosulfate sulfotransferase (PAPS reductase)/FAD synthetase